MVPVASWASAWSTRSAISWPGTTSPRSRCSSRIVRASDAIASSLVRSQPGPDLEVVAPSLLEMERAQRPLVAIANVRSDPLRRVVRSRDPELDPQGIEFRERPVGQELERPCRDPSTARFRRDDVAELELPSFAVDAEREREPEERPVVSIDDGERLPLAFTAALLVELEPLVLPPRRHRVGDARVTKHALVVEHPCNRR